VGLRPYPSKEDTRENGFQLTDRMIFKLILGSISNCVFRGRCKNPYRQLLREEVVLSPISWGSIWSSILISRAIQYFPTHCGKNPSWCSCKLASTTHSSNFKPLF